MKKMKKYLKIVKIKFLLYAVLIDDKLFSFQFACENKKNIS